MLVALVIWCEASTTLPQADRSFSNATGTWASTEEDSEWNLALAELAEDGTDVDALLKSAADAIETAEYSPGDPLPIDEV